MDKILRPERFNTETTDPNSEKQYRHWKMTFQNYINMSITEPAAPEGAERENYLQKKLYALFNHVSASVFELISDCASYDSAFEVLDKAYIKPVSIVYNRHKLITSKQEQSQTIDNFVQQLQVLAKSCQFEAVTATQNKNDYIREAFINGIHSKHIR